MVFSDFLNRQWSLAHWLAAALGQEDGILVPEADLFLRAGILDRADDHLARLIDVIGIGPVGKRPIVETDAPFVAHHPDAVLKAGHHILGKAAVFAEQHHLVGQPGRAEAGLVRLQALINERAKVVRVPALARRGRAEQIVVRVIPQAEPETGV